MKIKYTFILLLSTMLICFSACEDDDSNDQIKIEQLETDQTDFVLDIEETQTIKILEGAGNYRIFSLDEGIVSIVQLEDPTLFEVKGLKYGKTRILIADANSNIKTLFVQVEGYAEIKSDSEGVIELNGSYRSEVDIVINILEANGELQLSVSPNSVLASPILEGYKFTTKVFFVESNDVEITFVDETGHELKIQISVKIKDYKPPYTEEQYKTLLSESNIRYYEQLGEDVDYLSNDGTRINETDGDRHTYGWTYMNIPYWGDPIEVFKKISFKGDKTVGLKTEGKIEIASEWGGVDSYDLKHVEIMKVESGKIWCFFSYTNNWGGYSYGHFVDTINP